VINQRTTLFESAVNSEYNVVVVVVVVVVQNAAPPFWNLSAYLYKIEILQNVVLAYYA